jgi:hypothetical protein
MSEAFNNYLSSLSPQDQNYIGSLSPNDQSDINRTLLLYSRAQEIIQEHPEHDVSDIFHILRLQHLSPIERLWRGISREVSQDISQETSR